METGPILAVFSGRPGTGKTTIARALAARLRATFLRIVAAFFAQPGQPHDAACAEVGEAFGPAEP